MQGNSQGRRQSQAFIDYMNGKIGREQYLATYPPAIRASIKVPPKKTIDTLKFEIAENTKNKVSTGETTILDREPL